MTPFSLPSSPGSSNGSSRVVNMLEAKTHLSRLVEAIETGTEAEVVIARNGRTGWGSPADSSWRLIPSMPPTH